MVVLDSAGSSSSFLRLRCSSPVRCSMCPGEAACARHLGDSGAMNQGPPLYPCLQWRRKGVPGAHRPSPVEVAAEGPSEPPAESSVGLLCTALHRGETHSAAPFCASQVDGRGVLQGGTGRVIPRVPAPASVLSCWSAGRGDVRTDSESRCRREGEVKESVLNFWQTAGSRLTLFEEQTINSFM